MARCIAVIGASGVGKSTLVARLQALGGAVPFGAVAEGGAGLKISSFTYLGEAWTVLDCPGSLEFLQDVRDALLVADAAVVAVSPDPDQAVLAAPFLRAAEAAGVPALLFVNRMDE
ncbi:MAG: GTP-binding protein, partial [Pseudomonadota bacterium]